MELLKNTSINKYALKLIEGDNFLYGPIYSLGPIELEMLKAYIRTHLKTRLFQLVKFPASTSILFDKKLDRSLRLCVDYQGFHNLTIKNCYPLLLIDESLDRLGQAKSFTQLDLISAYY